MIWTVLYILAGLSWLYAAWIFYRSKNGLLRKALIMLFLGISGGTFVRVILFDIIPLETASMVAIILILIPLTVFNIIITKMKKGTE